MVQTLASYLCVSGGKICSFLGKFGVLCFLEKMFFVLRFALLPITDDLGLRFYVGRYYARVACVTSDGKLIFLLQSYVFSIRVTKIQCTLKTLNAL